VAEQLRTALFTNSSKGDRLPEASACLSLSADQSLQTSTLLIDNPAGWI
jgi:hypothetical protein